MWWSPPCRGGAYPRAARWSVPTRRVASTGPQAAELRLAVEVRTNLTHIPTHIPLERQKDRHSFGADDFRNARRLAHVKVSQRLPRSGCLDACEWRRATIED